MRPGVAAKSNLYPDKGIGKIIGITDLFGDQYAEVLFPDGDTLTLPVTSLESISNFIDRFSAGDYDVVATFIARNMLLRLEQNLSENKVTGSTNYKIIPLPHQILTVHFVLNRFQPRCLIADEVGLGKTIEAILAYQEFKLRKIVKRVLIVVPSGLLLQWHEELRNKFNETFIIYSTKYIRTLKQSYGEETNVWALNDKIIVSIDSVKPWKVDDELNNEEQERRQWHNTHVCDALATADFDLAIIDEAHKLSKRGDGHESARFKLGNMLAESIPVFLLLTATPHQGDPDLFHYLLKLVDPVLFAHKSSLKPDLVKEVCVRNNKRAAVDFDGNRIFKHRITSIVPVKRTEEENKDELILYSKVTEYISTWYNFAKRSNDQMLIMLLMLYQRILSSSSFALLSTMRKRKQFLLDDKIETDDTNLFEQEYEYDIDKVISYKSSIEEEMPDQEISFVNDCIVIAEKISKVYGDAKFKKIIDVIEEIKTHENNPSVKVIIFAEFRATLHALVDYLSRFGLECAIMHGTLKREERLEQIELFRKERQILVSTDAGGEGINLQFCHCIINFDLPWNPARLEQRIGRVDRIGQDHDAFIFNFHLENTVEDRVRKILESKLELIKKQFGEDRYADVMSFIQDEFSFDKVYINAIARRTAESKTLNSLAKKIYNRAKELIEQEELSLPFTSFSTDPQSLLNTELNNIVETLVTNYLDWRNIAVHWYKDVADLCYFRNPLPQTIDVQSTFRNVAFRNIDSTKSEKIELINAEHPLVLHIKNEFKKLNEIGRCCAFRVKAGKFIGVKGFWFVFKFTATNHFDRTRNVHVSVFMEDEEFCNNRISAYLSSAILHDIEQIQNYSPDNDFLLMLQNAEKAAMEKAKDLFMATKLEWMQEINSYKEKTTDYFKLNTDFRRALSVI